MIFFKKGIFVYLFVYLLILLLGLYFIYRKNYPLVPLEALLQRKSNFALQRDNPCFDSITGEPALKDSHDFIKVTIFCPNSPTSTNTLRYSGLKNSTSLSDILTLISEINNFNFILSPQKNQIESLGSIKNAEKKWRVKVNGLPVDTSFVEYKINPADTIEIIYE